LVPPFLLLSLDESPRPKQIHPILLKHFRSGPAFASLPFSFGGVAPGPSLWPRLRRLCSRWVLSKMTHPASGQIQKTEGPPFPCGRGKSAMGHGIGQRIDYSCLAGSPPRIGRERPVKEKSSRRNAGEPPPPAAPALDACGHKDPRYPRKIRAGGQKAALLAFNLRWC